MKRLLVVFFLSFVLLGAMPAQNKEKRHGFFIEASAAFALLNPRDLNAAAAAQQNLTAFNYSENFEWAQRNAGGNFSYTLQEPKGSRLQQIRNGLPIDLRLGYAIHSRIAVFLGLQYLERRRSSSLQQTYRVNDLRPDQVTPGNYVTEIVYPDFFLAARAWIPQLGLKFDIFQKRSWTCGIRLAAGPMFAQLRTIEERRYKKTDADGYWTERRYMIDMKGQGTGFAWEAVVRMARPVSSRLNLIMEGGYARRVGSGFSGPGSYESQESDANAARDLIRDQWEKGEWRTRREEIHQLWGDLEYTLSGNYFNSSANVGEFRLDLSGWQLAIGLTLAF